MEKRNDVVIVQDPNVVRGKWTIGMWTINVNPRKDFRVRNVKLETPTAEYQRPITKIVVIYPAEGYDDLSFKDDDTILIGAETVKIINGLCEQLS